MTQEVVRVDTRDFDEKMRKIETQSQSELLKAIRRPAKKGERRMKQTAPKYKGDLRSSISTRKTGTMELTIAPFGTPYAVDMIEGTSTIDSTFSEISSWAGFRGLPAGPVWYKLITQGIDSAQASPHRENYRQRAYDRLKRVAHRDAGRHINKWIGGL